jgi:hypothetical protein
MAAFPYFAIAATFILAGTVIALCWQTDDPPKAKSFSATAKRRKVTYRAAVLTPRINRIQDAA